MAFSMPRSQADRFAVEAKEAETEAWLANAARWPCPWIWHEIDGPWQLADLAVRLYDSPGIT